MMLQTGTDLQPALAPLSLLHAIFSARSDDGICECVNFERLPAWGVFLVKHPCLKCNFSKGIILDALQDANVRILFLFQSHAFIKYHSTVITTKVGPYDTCMIHIWRIFIFSSHRHFVTIPGQLVAAGRESL